MLAVTVVVTRREGLGFALGAVELVAIFLVRRLGLARRGRARRQRQELEGMVPEKAEDGPCRLRTYVEKS